VDRESLNLMTRDELIAYARRTGMDRPEGMTRAELQDEIVRRTEFDAERRRLARGWFGVARDLVASLIEQGLHLPDAAKLIRGDTTFRTRVQAPIATVALAEIYAAQGHAERALRLLEQVLAKEPDHPAARRLHARLSQPVAPPPPSAADPEAADGAATVLAETTPPPSPAEAEDAELAQAVVADTVPPPATGEVEGAESAVAPPPAADVAGAEAAVAVVADTTPPPAPGEGPAEEAPDAAGEPACDAALSVAGRERSHYVYWELTRATSERARRLSPVGHPALKIVFFTPSRDGAHRSERVVSVRSSAGSITLESPTPNAVACAALGWQSPGEFLPLVVATPLTAPLLPRAAESMRAVQARARAAYR
jgi:hypothetical protein